MNVDDAPLPKTAVSSCRLLYKAQLRCFQHCNSNSNSNSSKQTKRGKYLQHNRQRLTVAAVVVRRYQRKSIQAQVQRVQLQHRKLIASLLLFLNTLTDIHTRIYKYLSLFICFVVFVICNNFHKSPRECCCAL